jgi:hypothetical protein
LARKTGEGTCVLIPLDVAHYSGMISPAIPR